MRSTPLIACDQHAVTTVAAVLLPGQRMPALHSLTSDSPTILRFVTRLQREVDRAMLLQGRPLRLRVAARAGRSGHRREVIAPAH